MADDEMPNVGRGFAEGVAAGKSLRKGWSDWSAKRKAKRDAASLTKSPDTFDDFADDVRGVAGRDVAPSEGGGEYTIVRKGGRITKAGVYRLHANEVVLPAKLARKVGRKASRSKSRR